MNPTRIFYDGPHTDEIVNQAKKKLADYETYLRGAMGDDPVGTKKLQLGNCEVTLEVFGLTNRLTIVAPPVERKAYGGVWHKISVKEPVIQEILKKYTNIREELIEQVEFEMLPAFYGYAPFNGVGEPTPRVYQTFTFGAGESLQPAIQIPLPPEQVAFYKEMSLQRYKASYEAVELFSYEKRASEVARVMTVNTGSIMSRGVMCEYFELIVQLHPIAWNGVTWSWGDDYYEPVWTKMPKCLPADKCFKCDYPSTGSPGRSTTYAYTGSFATEWYPAFYAAYDHFEDDEVKLIGTPVSPYAGESHNEGEWTWWCNSYCNSPIFTIHHEPGYFGSPDSVVEELKPQCSQFWINPATGRVDCGGVWDGEHWWRNYEKSGFRESNQGGFYFGGAAVDLADWFWTGILIKGDYWQPLEAYTYGWTYSYEYAGLCPEGASSEPSTDPVDVEGKCHLGHLQAVILAYTPDFEVYIKEMQCHRIYVYSGDPEVTPVTVYDPGGTQPIGGGYYVKPEFLPNLVASGPESVDLYPGKRWYYGEAIGEPLFAMPGWTHEVGKCWGSDRVLKEYQPYAGSGSGAFIDNFEAAPDSSTYTGGHIYSFGGNRMYLGTGAFMRLLGYADNEGVTNNDGTPVEIAPNCPPFRPLQFAVFSPAGNGQKVYGEAALEPVEYLVHIGDNEQTNTHYISWAELHGYSDNDPYPVYRMSFSKLRDYVSITEGNDNYFFFHWHAYLYSSTYESTCFTRLRFIMGRQTIEEEEVRRGGSLALYDAG